jgi:type II secretory pathway component HofQ
VEEGGQYLDDRVAEMFGRVQQRSFRDSHAAPIIIHNIETGEEESVPVDTQAADTARDRFVYLASDQNFQVASTTIEQTLIFYQENMPSSQEVAETLDQMVAHRNSSPHRRSSYPN